MSGESLAYEKRNPNETTHGAADPSLCGCCRRDIHSPAGAGQPSKPNVVFVLFDNVGYGDLGAYGGAELRGAPTHGRAGLAVANQR